VKAARPRKKPASPQAAEPWQIPPAMANADIFALQALERGTANPAQQQRAIAFIELTLCATDRMSFYPGGLDGRRASDFAEGKRWVGLQLRRVLRLRPDHGDGRAREEPPSRPKSTREVTDAS
jgi:hypothetical protein